MKQHALIPVSPAVLAVLLLACSSAHSGGAYTIERANGYASAHDWNGLLGYSTAWTRAEPNEPMAWFYLGNTYGQPLKRPDQALPAFERAVKLRPNWPEAWNALGHVNVQLQRYDDAAKSFSRALEQKPKNANYWNSLAAVYSYQNRISMTVKTLEDEQRAISGSSVFEDWYNLGNGFSTMQEYGSAAAAYRRALQLKPDFGPAWNNLGSIEAINRDTQAALNDYQRAAALGDGLGANNYARLQQAIAASRQANNEDPLRTLRMAQGAELQYRAQQAWQNRLAAAQN